MSDCDKLKIDMVELNVITLVSPPSVDKLEGALSEFTSEKTLKTVYKALKREELLLASFLSLEKPKENEGIRIPFSHVISVVPFRVGFDMEKYLKTTHHHHYSHLGSCGTADWLYVALCRKDAQVNMYNKTYYD